MGGAGPDHHRRRVLACRTEWQDVMSTLATAPTPQVPAPADRPTDVKAHRPVEVFVLLVFLTALVGGASLISPAFMSIANLRDILTQAAPLCFVAMGQAFVIMVRGLDLSVG